MLEDDLEELCVAINSFEAVGMIESIENIRIALHKILQHAVKSGNLKDTFEYFWRCNPQIIILAAKSVKTQVDYAFYYDYLKNTLHFRAFIHNAYNVKNLQDRFLIDFFNVCDQNRFEYHQNAFSSGLEKRFPDLHRTFKGNIFRLMRNYFLFVSESGGDDGNLDLGYFSVSWDFDKDIETIYNELCIAMKWFYKFNYNLWKIEYLKKQK